MPAFSSSLKPGELDALVAFLETANVHFVRKIKRTTPLHLLHPHLNESAQRKPPV